MLPFGEAFGHRSVAGGELLEIGQRFRIGEGAGSFEGLDRIDRRPGESRRHGVEQVLGGAAFQLINDA